MRFFQFTACALVLAVPLPAEIALHAPEPSHSVPPQFASQQLRRSGMIFSGAVLSVVHVSAPASVGTTQITFKVESAVRGTRAGQLLRVREWQGLWNSGERYHVGERVLLFLYPSSKLGLTSPVGGALGRYAIDKSGRVLVNDGQGPRPKPIQLRSFVAAIRSAAKE